MMKVRYTINLLLLLLLLFTFYLKIPNCILWLGETCL